MHILLELDLSLYFLLFFVGGLSGILVRIDQWVEGMFSHPTTTSGKLDVIKSFWSYVLIFVLSGLAGTIVAIGASYGLQNRDSNILLFIAVMVGAVGKLIFYKLVEWVHKKFDDAVTPSQSRKNRESRRK